MNKLEYCFHSHTKRCGHAFGEDEEYVKAAMKAGLKAMGFSDHAMFPFMSQPRMRGDYSLLPGYVASVRDLERKYKDEIAIRLGFESEWIGKDRSSYYEALYRDCGFDYFILGHHMWFDADANGWFARLPMKEALKRYVDDIIEAMQSGYFLYLAHPDVFMSWHGSDFGPMEEEASERLIDAAVKYDIPLELNMGYSRWGDLYKVGDILTYLYPYLPFWDMVKERGAKVVIGVDAHDPSDYQDSDFAYFENIVNDKKLCFLEKDEVLTRIAALKERWGHR